MLVANSDIIAIGTVVNQELVSRPQYVEVPVPCWTPSLENAGKECFGKISGAVGWYLTDYTIQIEQYVKGDGAPSTEVVVREGGGVIDGVRIVVDVSPAYEVGKRYLVFLKREPQEPGVMYTLAGNLGAYELNSGEVDRLSEATGYHAGAPLLLESLSEREALSLIQEMITAQARGE